MDITFRLAEEKDLPNLVTIYNQAILKKTITATLKLVTVESQKPWFLSHQKSKNRPLFVILEKNKIVGYTYLSDFYGRKAYKNTAEISIYLAQDMAGKKIGTKTLAFMEKEAEKIGIKTLLAFIFATNLASIQLFEKFDYVSYGFLPKIADMGNETLDLAILGKKLKGTH